LILLAKCAQLRHAEVLFAEAPASKLKASAQVSRINVLHLNQSIPPALRQHRRLQVDAVDAEAMKLFERRELPGNPFDLVGDR
jgi:hypothetical protein